MRFLVDAQLSPALVTWLRAKGHHAEHVASVLGERAPDKDIVTHAKATGAVIVSKDGDFISLLEVHPNAPQLLRIRLGNAVNRVLFAHLDRAWARVESALSAGASVVELD